MPQFTVGQTVVAKVTITNNDAIPALISLQAAFGAHGSTPATWPYTAAEQTIPANGQVIFPLTIQLPMSPQTLGVLIVNVLGRFSSSAQQQSVLVGESTSTDPVVVNYPAFNLSVSVGF